MTTAHEQHDALGELLRHPQLWRARGRDSTAAGTLSSGFAALDQRLPGEGWPVGGLVELLVERPGIGELSLVMPVLARCGTVDPDAWLAWIAPPHEPYAPALVAAGIEPERLLVVRTTQALWAMEQTLRSCVCAAVLGWVDAADMRSLRRLKLAAEKSHALGFLFRPVAQRRQASPAELRLLLSPDRHGLEIELLKSRGGAPGKVVLPMNPGRSC